MSIKLIARLPHHKVTYQDIGHSPTGSSMTPQDVRYLLFDIESVADGDLIRDVRYAGEPLSAEQAIEKYRTELFERTGNEFIPYTFQQPISVAIIKISHDLKIIDVVTLDEPQHRPHIITKHFWEGWRAYNSPTFISFNGRTFDIPLMELSAFRFGIPIPDWFNVNERTYDQRRNRYNNNAHLDIQEILTNYGATRFNGGLNLAANLLGKPGKMGIAGHMVQDLYDQGELKQINDYCRCDVLDTYFVFLRTQLLVGSIGLADEDTLIQHAHGWLAERVEEFPVYGEYLDSCRPWKNPWLNSSTETPPTTTNSESAGSIESKGVDSIPSNRVQPEINRPENDSTGPPSPHAPHHQNPAKTCSDESHS